MLPQNTYFERPSTYFRHFPVAESRTGAVFRRAGNLGRGANIGRLVEIPRYKLNARDLEIQLTVMSLISDVPAKLLGVEGRGVPPTGLNASSSTQLATTCPDNWNPAARTREACSWQPRGPQLRPGFATAGYQMRTSAVGNIGTLWRCTRAIK